MTCWKEKIHEEEKLEGASMNRRNRIVTGVLGPGVLTRVAAGMNAAANTYGNLAF